MFYCKLDIFYIFLVFFVFLLVVIGEIFIFYYIGEVIDSIVIEKNKVKFMIFIFVMILILLGIVIVIGLRGGFFFLIVVRFFKRISNFLFGSIVK